MTSPFPVHEPEEKDDACAEQAACENGIVVTSAWSNRFRETSRTRLVTSSRRHVTRRDNISHCCYCCWRPRRTSRHHYVIKHDEVVCHFSDFFITVIHASSGMFFSYRYFVHIQRYVPLTVIDCQRAESCIGV